MPRFNLNLEVSWDSNHKTRILVYNRIYLYTGIRSNICKGRLQRIKVYEILDLYWRRIGSFQVNWVKSRRVTPRGCVSEEWKWIYLIKFSE